MIAPKALKNGDFIYITAPAKAVDEKDVLSAKIWFESQGYQVDVAKHCLGQHHYFSGTDQERTEDFQEGLNNPKYKAIFCARGGYGCVRIVAALDWSEFIQNPKWIIGFSDITVFHHKTLSLGIQSIHGIMAFGFEKNRLDTLSSLKNMLTHTKSTLTSDPYALNCFGSAEGALIGGNLTILYSLLATPLTLDFRNRILFIEEVGEHVYKIDRMLQTMEMHGVFDQISGLIVGGITEVEDTTPPFGKDVHTLIYERVQDKSIPVCFNFSTGHIDENLALGMGKKIMFVSDAAGGKILM